MLMIGILGVACLGERLLRLCVDWGWWQILGSVGDVLADLIGLGDMCDSAGVNDDGVERSPSRLTSSLVLFTTENTSKSGSTPRSVPLLALDRYLSNE